MLNKKFLATGILLLKSWKNLNNYSVQSGKYLPKRSSFLANSYISSILNSGHFGTSTIVSLILYITDFSSFRSYFRNENGVYLYSGRYIFKPYLNKLYASDFDLAIYAIYFFEIYTNKPSLIFYYNISSSFFDMPSFSIYFCFFYFILIIPQQIFFFINKRICWFINIIMKQISFKFINLNYVVLKRCRITSWFCQIYNLIFE